MQRPNSKITSLILITTMLSACGEPGGPGVMHGGSGLNKEDVGTAAGAIAGGVIGYQFGGGAGQALATVGGVLLGGFLGNQIGKSLDNADRAAYDRASQRALETGSTQSWRNPDTGHRGTIVPGDSYREDGQLCRQYSQTIYIDGKKNKGHGTACRNADGSWQIVN